jgi:uncharacterized metal-binding protein
MPNGRVHTNVTLMIAATYSAGALVTLSIGNLEYVAGALLGVLIHPDLDVDHGKVVTYKLLRKAGIIPYHTWRTVWYMYRRSLKHGGDLSHFPVVSTIGRIVYLFLTVIVVPYILLAPVLHLNLWYELNWWAWLVIVHYKVTLGLMTADFFHWLLDVATTEHKRKHGQGISKEGSI